MRSLRSIWLWLSLISLLVFSLYLGHLVQLTQNGYCHSADKYLSDEEKIKLALVDLLKKYPPAILKNQTGVDTSSFSPPIKPIFYSNLEQFLNLNPNCCTFVSPQKFREGPGQIDLIERLTNAATNLIEVKYLVRYLDGDKVPKENKTTTYLYITDCGTPANHSYNP